MAGDPPEALAPDQESAFGADRFGGVRVFRGFFPR